MGLEASKTDEYRDDFALPDSKAIDPVRSTVKRDRSTSITVTVGISSKRPCRGTYCKVKLVWIKCFSMCNTISLVHCFVPADSGVKLTKCEGSEGTMCESAEKLPISEARSPPDAIRTPGGGLYLLISALARVRAP